MMEKISSHYLREGESNGTKHYHTCIAFENLGSLAGSLRCESFSNNSIGAEIFIDNGNFSEQWKCCKQSAFKAASGV